MISLGIDLAGSLKRKSGICAMNERLKIILLKTVFEDEEILKIVKQAKPDIIAIDAPLSLPKGRKSLEKKGNIHFRKCDRELWKLGIKFFPITLGPMRKLTQRGIALKKKIEKLGFKVIEVYPGATQDLLNIPRKQKGLRRLARGLIELGIRGIKGSECGDELDAITAAYTGILYLKNEYTSIGDPSEGLIILPRIKHYNRKNTN
ncbi:MAG: DUF429 domain-containing protein [Candidatus Aenigmarchaeota archaeon]|nr:DUF429 domain-containing protein [Candidatus Aenigmarchaeota archaeon]